MMPLPDDLAALGTPPDAPVPDWDMDPSDEEQVALIADANTGNPADPDDPNPDAPRKTGPS